MSTKQLRRSNNRIICGVCGGLGEYFGIDPTIIRIIYALVTIFSIGIPGILAYVILMVIMPE